MGNREYVRENGRGGGLQGSGLNTIRVMPHLSFRVSRSLLVLASLSVASPAIAQTPPATADVPAKFDAPTAGYDYVKRVEMIPMRDGVKLYTVIVIPR